MSSEVEICNLALAHLGDSASVASLDPPEGSAQAEHCARFYPIARDALLEMHEWNFATRRIALSLLAATNDQWLYVYAVPNLMAKALAVISPDADNDYAMSSAYVPQPYAIETLDTGEVVICTNMEDAVLRYTALVSDPVKFSPLFTLCLSWLLASMLAGPVIKGDVGMAEGKRCYQMMQAHLSAATVSDANQQNLDTSDATRHFVPWLTGR
jgi:hypothetical protein